MTNDHVWKEGDILYIDNVKSYFVLVGTTIKDIKFRLVSFGDFKEDSTYHPFLYDTDNQVVIKQFLSIGEFKGNMFNVMKEVFSE